MYLETILILSKKKQEVHSVDVGDHMGFSKSSVSRAIGILKKGGFVVMEKDGALSLTEHGRRVAEKIYERHNLLTDFFSALGVDPEIAAQDACKVEHDISDDTVFAIKTHLQKIKESSK